MDRNDGTRDKTGTMGSSTHGGPGPALMGAHTLMGNDVYNDGDEDLGDIKAFMLDMASGQIADAVLDFGGVIGIGDKLFAVPWSALTLDTVNKRLTLGVKASLQDAPGFDRDRWPAMADPAWASRVHQFDGTVQNGR